MIAQRLNGTKESERIIQRLVSLTSSLRRPITLATILVGSRYDSALYVKLKRKAAARAGIHTTFFHLPEKVSQKKLEELLHTLNRDTTVYGILLQLPLPKHLDADAAIAVMDPKKDADGFHKANTFITPPPIAATLHLLKLAHPKPNSFATIVAKPSVFTERLAHELDRLGYPTAITSPHPNMSLLTTASDILITAIGTSVFIHAAEVKKGAIIIDVGIRKHGKKAVGDISPNVWNKAAAISPVPGGVGPMTIAYLLWNTYQLAKKR